MISGYYFTFDHLHLGFVTMAVADHEFIHHEIHTILPMMISDYYFTFDHLHFGFVAVAVADHFSCHWSTGNCQRPWSKRSPQTRLAEL